MFVKEVPAASGPFPVESMFAVTVGGAPLAVVRFFGTEGISSLFEFRVEVAGTDLDIDALLGQSATLTIKGLDMPRLVHGVISEAEYTGNTNNHEIYELTISPYAHRLMHQDDNRIFQDKTTEQIVTDVLVKAGFNPRWFRFSLSASYAPRVYCSQYHETHLAFISRLLEEDGIFYFFEHDEHKHVLVMADSAQVHTPIPGSPALEFHPPHGNLVQDREHIKSFRLSGRVQPGKVTLRDFNLDKTDVPMEVTAAAKTNAELEVYDFPGGYQDPGRNGPGEGQWVAKIRLESLQSTRKVGNGESDCPRLTPGRIMTMVGHPRDDLNGEYRVVQVRHTGTQPQTLEVGASGQISYQNNFMVTDLKVPFRPARQTRRPKMRGLQTATVVGPGSEEVHTDKDGRVRVQFHWDREGNHDEHSATWVPVSQLWAGNGYGSMFIPRIGHQVLVDFIEGDPDRPVVVGRLYHGQHATPYPLPDEKTKSTIKSDSSLGGGGYNELCFEDRKGAEQIILHAQKDWNTVILDSLTESVGADRKATVGKSDSTVVGVTHSVTITQPSTPPPQVPPTGTTMEDKFFRVTSGTARVVVNGDDVFIVAAGNITLAAEGNVAINAGGTVSIGAGGAVSLTSDGIESMIAEGKGGLGIGASEAINVNSEGTTSLQRGGATSVKSGGAASVIAGAEVLILKGPLVKIN